MPIWVDEAGKPLPSAPARAVAKPVPVTPQIAPRAVKGTPCTRVRVMNWCGHGEEWLPSPWGLLPVWESSRRD
jgi:hypothetical protein